MSMPQQPLSPTKLLALIMGALALWGVYVAIGAYLYNRNPWRPLIVLASVGIFLGIWMLLLWGQSRRQRKS
ncbi:MAG TPA: hypothetical protein VGJ16_10150 [Pirellulales bacterium]